MTTEAPALLPCFLDWHVLPRNVYSPSVAAYAGLYPVTILIHPGGIIPIERLDLGKLDKVCDYIAIFHYWHEILKLGWFFPLLVTLLLLLLLFSVWDYIPDL